MFRGGEETTMILNSNFNSILTTAFALGALATFTPPALRGAPDAAADAAAVAALDTEYQEAVKRNDAVTMDRILHEDFVLVVGNGTAYGKEALLESARTQEFVYERQDEEPGTQKVRVWGDTAVVTAKLWLKGIRDGKLVDKKLWFSDTYVRTPQGWRYFFGQASLGLPE
jgi:ketosteroid isomerase-like protein